jgi:hypothetical protein
MTPPSGHTSLSIPYPNEPIKIQYYISLHSMVTRKTLLSCRHWSTMWSLWYDLYEATDKFVSFSFWGGGSSTSCLKHRSLFAFVVENWRNNNNFRFLFVAHLVSKLFILSDPRRTETKLVVSFLFRKVKSSRSLSYSISIITPKQNNVRQTKILRTNLR